MFKGEPEASQTLPSETTLGQSFIDWLKSNFRWMFEQAQANTSIGTAYIYDEDGSLLGEYDNGSAKAAGRTEYIWLPTEAGQPIPVGIFRNGNFFAIHSDHLGTPRLMTNEDNKPVWQWPYSAFGANKPTGILQATPNPRVAITNQPVLLKATAATELNLRFPGQYFDSETNLHYNYFRSYQPNQGRYTQADPIGLDGGLNRFGYVEGNALLSTDPRGLNVVLANADRAAGLKSGRAIDLLKAFFQTGNLSGNIPICGPFGVSYSCKASGNDGALSCYVGAGIVAGSSFSFAPRISPQITATGGETSGFGYRVNASSPGVAGPFGATGSISGSVSGGVTVQGGPAVVGGSPSASATIGYTFK